MDNITRQTVVPSSAKIKFLAISNSLEKTTKPLARQSVTESITGLKLSRYLRLCAGRLVQRWKLKFALRRASRLTKQVFSQHPPIRYYSIPTTQRIPVVCLTEHLDAQTPFRLRAQPPTDQISESSSVKVSMRNSSEPFDSIKNSIGRQHTQQSSTV